MPGNAAIGRRIEEAAGGAPSVFRRGRTGTQQNDGGNYQRQQKRKDVEGEDRHEDTRLLDSRLLAQYGEQRLSAFRSDQIGFPADRAQSVAA